MGEACNQAPIFYHLSPQTDDQTEVVNRTFGQMLRCMIVHNIREWKELIPHIEFAYNIRWCTSPLPTLLLRLHMGLIP